MDHNYKDIEKRIARAERILDTVKTDFDSLRKRAKEIEVGQSNLAAEIAKEATDLSETEYRIAWVEFQLGLI